VPTRPVQAEALKQNIISLQGSGIIINLPVTGTKRQPKLKLAGAAA
jgi:hypothetical protein